MRLEDLYEASIASVREALAGGPVILAEVPGGLFAETLATHLPRPVAALDARIAGEEAGFTADLARQIIVLATGVEQTLDSVARLGAHARTAVALVAGRRTDAVVATASGAGDPAGVDELLSAIPDGVGLVVAHAHLLDADLWALRAHAERLRIVLATRRWYRNALDGPRAPFFGYGTAVDLEPPSPADWERAGVAVAHVPVDDALQNVALMREMIEAGVGDPRRGWESAVAGRSAQLDAVLGGALAAHALGPRLLLLIAQGRPPYGVVPAVAPNRVALALRRLRDAELIHQPGPRRWVLSDPALAVALRSRAGAGNLHGAA